MAGQWINKVGVEVECGVEPEHADKSYTGFDTTTDGSLRSNGARTSCREYVSNPFNYADQLPYMHNRLEDIYEHINEINESMGLHIHVSLTKDEYYYRLASKKFEEYFIERLKQSQLWEENERLRKRVNGEPREDSSRDADYFCRELQPEVIDQQLQDRRGGGRKYRRIVFFKHKYDTVEFRLFPAMDNAEQVMQAIKITTKAINSYMQNTEYTEQTEVNVAKPEATETNEAMNTEMAEAGGVHHNV